MERASFIRDLDIIELRAKNITPKWIESDEYWLKFAKMTNETELEYRKAYRECSKLCPISCSIEGYPEVLVQNHNFIEKSSAYGPFNGDHQ